MLTVAFGQPFGACTAPAAPDSLFNKLTGIKVLGTQIISNDDARGVSEAMVDAVRCNAEDAARKVIVPAVVIAGAAAILAGVAAIYAWRARHLPAGRKRNRGGLGIRNSNDDVYEEYDDDVDVYDECHDADGCYIGPRPDEADCLVIGKKHSRYTFGAYRVCLTPNQEKTLFRNQRKKQKKLGCGVFACAYTTPAKTRVVKFTRDSEDVAALLEAQKTGVVPKVHAVYRLENAGRSIATGDTTPVYALVVERLKVFSPREREEHDEEIFGTVHDIVSEAKRCSRSPGQSRDEIAACRSERVEEACEDYSCSTLTLGVVDAALKLYDIGIDWSDIHSGNIGLDSKGHVKVLDLGVTGTALKKPVKVLKGVRFRRIR